MSYEFTLTDGSPLTTVDPLESNGLGAQSVPRQVLDINFSDNSFVIADDLSSRFIAGFSFDIVTGPYLGTYVVAGGGSTYDGATNTTSIPAVATITSAPLTVSGVVPGASGVGSWKVEGAANGDCVYYPGATFTVADTGAADGNYTVLTSEVSSANPIFAVVPGVSGVGSWTLTGDYVDFYDAGVEFKISSNNPGTGTYEVVSAVLDGLNTKITVMETISIAATTVGTASIVPAVTRITVTGAIPVTVFGPSPTATVPPSVAYTFSSPPTMLTNIAPNTYTIIWHLTGNHESKFTLGCPVIIKDNNVFDDLNSTVLTAVDNGANTDVTVQFKYPTTPAAPDATGTLTYPLPPIPFGFLQYDIIAVDSSLKLIGRGSPAFNNDVTWGEMLQENDIRAMEHWRTADGTPPPAPLAGQLWYDEMTPALQLFASTLYDVVAVVTGAGGTWTISGNHDAVPELQPPQKIVVYNDTGSGPDSEVYTIASVTNSGPNTDIVIIGGESIPATANADGTLYAFADWHTLVIPGFPVTGDLDMGGYNICNLGLTSAAASEYPISTVSADCVPSIDFADARYVNATDPSGDSMLGILNMGTNFIQDLAAPLLGTDAANKTYVDSLISGIVWLTPVQDPNMFDDTLGGPDAGSSADISDPFAIYYRTFIVKPTAYTINGSISGLGGTWTISGNYTSVFVAGDTFVVDGDTGGVGADGTYTVASAVDNGGNHDIVVVETIPVGAGNDGTLYHARAGWNGAVLLGAGLVSHGHAVVYDPVLVAWKSVLTDVSNVERPVTAMDRFGIFMVPDNDDPLSTLPGGSFTGDSAKIYTAVSVSTPDYTVTWDAPYTPLEPDATSVMGTNSVHFGLSYTFRGTWGTGVFNTDYKWIQFVGPSMIVDGAGLMYTGNILNVVVGGGLTFTSGELVIDVGTGLEFSGNTVVADIGTGLEFSGNEIIADIGTGLILSGNTIVADLGLGLTFSANDIVVDIEAGMGLTFSGNELTVDTTYLDTLYLTCGSNACAPTFTGLTLSGPLETTGTSHLNVPVGTTAERPVTPTEGDTRGNSDIASGSFEIYINGAWQTIQTAGRQSIWLPAASWTSRTTNGAEAATLELGTNDIMITTFDFDQTTSEGIQFMMATPKSWNKGTVSFTPYWTASVGAGTVTWTLAGGSYSNSDPLDAALGTAVGVTDTLLTLEDLHIGAESTAVTIAGSPAESDMAVFEITRDVADTLTGDGRLLGIMLFITHDLPNDN